MQEKVSRFIAENPSWVIDGNYLHKIGTMAIDTATDIICAYSAAFVEAFSHVPAIATDAVGLDPPFWRYYPRVIIRTFLRWIGLQENCAPGCPEKLREFYAADGMLRCAWRGHNKYRTRFEHLVDGDSRLKRFGGWWYLKSLQEWLASVAATGNKNAL